MKLGQILQGQMMNDAWSNVPKTVVKKYSSNPQSLAEVWPVTLEMRPHLCLSIKGTPRSPPRFANPVVDIAASSQIGNLLASWQVWAVLQSNWNLAVFLRKVLKNRICGKSWSNCAKLVFICVSVTPKEVESVEIFHAQKSLLHNNRYNIGLKRKLDDLNVKITKKSWTGFLYNI